MKIGRLSYTRYRFSTGKSIYLSEKEEKELEDHYEEILTPSIREQAKKDYAPQMQHIALSAALGFSRKRYTEAGEMSKVDPSDIKKEVPVDDDDEDFLDTVSDESDDEYPDGYPDGVYVDWDEDDVYGDWDDDDDLVTDPEGGDR
jgi:hypothetical protein